MHHQARVRVVVAVLVSLSSACAATGCASGPHAASATSSSSSSAAGGADHKQAARAQLDELAHAASGYALSNGHCAQSVDDLVRADASLSANDPWGHPVALMRASEDAPQSFVSAGPDGELLTADDISVRAECADR